MVRTKMKMKPFEWFAYLLMAVGALNVGVDAVLNFNIIGWALGIIPGLATFGLYVSGAIGLAGAYAIYKIWY